MNKTFYISFLFLSLLFLQVFILNHINFLGYVNPYLYISFVIFYPLKKERLLFLLLAFLLGLSIDFFSDSGGAHASSLLCIAFLRLFFVRMIFKKTELDYLLFKLHEEPFGKVFNYVIILTVIHHFIFFSLANFTIYNFSGVLINTLYSSIFTAILYFLGTYIIRYKK